jgi:hypothetical protein
MNLCPLNTYTDCAAELGCGPEESFGKRIKIAHIILRPTAEQILAVL